VRSHGLQWSIPMAASGQVSWPPVVSSSCPLTDGLRDFRGTVVAVTHDRWFARSFTRFVVFDEDNTVREASEARWDLAKGHQRRGAPAR
ncbi:MAG: hypothetical protein ACYCYK_04465, partial [Candidatus Dormibacteria bacterium]